MFDLDHIFTYQRPTAEQVVLYTDLRDAAHEFAKVIVKCTPQGADQAAAIRKVREAVMTANAAIALDGKLHIEETVAQEVKEILEEVQNTHRTMLSDLPTQTGKAINVYIDEYGNTQGAI